MPDWEKHVDQDIVTRIFNAWNDGTTSAGSTDVVDAIWITRALLEHEARIRESN